MKYLSAFLAALPLVAAHGSIVSPPSRGVGPAMKAACGEQVYNNQASDKDGNSQGELQIAKQQKDYNPAKCNLFLCKGYQFEDNQSKVQTYSPGQKIALKIEIHAPHSGTMNVSVVDTKSNSIIGTPLITSGDYAPNSRPIGPSDTDLSVTLPTNFNGKCAVAGECVLQWWWDARNIDQTYESCTDFKVGGGSGAAPAAPGKAVVPNKPWAPSKPVAPSKPAAVVKPVAQPVLAAPAAAAPAAADDGETASGTTSPAPGYGGDDSASAAAAPAAPAAPAAAAPAAPAAAAPAPGRYQPRPNTQQLPQFDFGQFKNIFQGFFSRFFQAPGGVHKRQESVPTPSAPVATPPTPTPASSSASFQPVLSSSPSSPLASLQGAPTTTMLMSVMPMSSNAPGASIETTAPRATNASKTSGAASTTAAAGASSSSSGGSSSASSSSRNVGGGALMGAAALVFAAMIA